MPNAKEAILDHGVVPAEVARFTERDVEDVLRYGAKALGIGAEVCERQYIPVGEPALDSSRIDVNTSGTTVTVSGTVLTKAEHQRALQLARETAGVTDVVDRLGIAER